MSKGQEHCKRRFPVLFIVFIAYSISGMPSSGSEISGTCGSSGSSTDGSVCEGDVGCVCDGSVGCVCAGVVGFAAGLFPELPVLLPLLEGLEFDDCELLGLLLLLLCEEF